MESEGETQPWKTTGAYLRPGLVLDKLTRLLQLAPAFTLTFSTANVLITYSARSSVSIRVTLMSL